MPNLLRSAAAAALLSLSAAGLAQAQSAERVSDNGTVWEISQIETKPGMFDDYMAYLSGPWRQIQEARKKAGEVVSYRVLSKLDARDGEPDVILMVEYKNMAVYDQPLAVADKQTAAVFGSPVKANQAAVSREAMRTTRGAYVAREVKFIK